MHYSSEVLFLKEFICMESSPAFGKHQFLTFPYRIAIINTSLPEEGHAVLLNRYMAYNLDKSVVYTISFFTIFLH